MVQPFVKEIDDGEISIVLIDNKVISLVDNEAEIIEDQKVKVIYNEENYDFRR